MGTKMGTKIRKPSVHKALRQIVFVPVFVPARRPPGCARARGPSIHGALRDFPVCPRFCPRLWDFVPAPSPKGRKAPVSAGLRRGQNTGGGRDSGQVDRWVWVWYN